MRVLHVIPSVSAFHGGPSKAIVNMEQALVAQGVAVTTVTTDDDGPSGRRPMAEMPEGTPGLQRIYFRKWFEFYKVAPGLLLWLWRHVGKFDVVHIHALFSFASMAAVWAARLRGVPYVLRPLGTLTRYGLTQRRPLLKRLSLAWLEGPALRRAAAVHFTSDDERREAAECGVVMRGVVVPLGIEAFKPADGVLVRAHFPTLGSARYLLYLSRLDPKKNVEGLLRAFSQCSASWPDVQLVVAGDGAPGYVAGLKALSVELGLDDGVVWAGHIDGDLKVSALMGAELFVLPSFSENFGIAAAEALMAGLPCVLGQGVAIAQDVVNAGAGVAVAPDPASIAAGLKRVMADVQVRAGMAVRASALAREKYSAQAMGANLVALYEDLLGRRNPPASEMTGIEK